MPQYIFPRAELNPYYGMLLSCLCGFPSIQISIDTAYNPKTRAQPHSRTYKERSIQDKTTPDRNFGKSFEPPRISHTESHVFTQLAEDVFTFRTNC